MFETTPQESAAERLLTLALGTAHTQAVAAAARLGLADHLADGPLSVTRLADLADADAGALARLAETLVALGVLRDTGDGRVECTETGELLRSGTAHSVRHYVTMMGSAWLTGGWPGLTDSVRSGAPAFESAQGMPYYAYVRRHPEAEEILQQGLSDISRHEADAFGAAVDVSGHATVADIGGGRGSLLAELLRRSPGTRGVLFDLPEVVRHAGRELAGPLRARVRVVAGDFLTDPLPAADLYVLKRVLMDQDDARALTLLGNVRAAAVPGARVLIADPPADTRYGRLLDLHMLNIHGSGLRSAAQLSALLEKAGFRAVRQLPVGGTLRLLEAEA
ncbi:methyltransferase [Streptomyces sp. NPDC047017]|uniref:methyltransferase n=1 Tax=Streptomyces sp. NPDC047017 TaxID=3155024 RepID=UPI00340F26D8